MTQSDIGDGVSRLLSAVFPLGAIPSPQKFALKLRRQTPELELKNHEVAKTDPKRQPNRYRFWG
jgi:hypothetical protein